jgi:NAD(P)-dependent dehydrogenase (short-subunit alcohol dehydrogenase family)
VLALVIAGLIAFTMTLAKEGIKYNIKSNVIAPVSRLNIY